MFYQCGLLFELTLEQALGIDVRYRVLVNRRGPNGIRIRVCGLKGRRPRPLDDGAKLNLQTLSRQI